MDDVLKRMESLKEEFDDLYDSKKINELQSELDELKQSSVGSQFWKDNAKAQKSMIRLSELEDKLKLWQHLKNEINETSQLINLNDDSIKSEIDKNIDKIETEFERLKVDTSYADPHDSSSAILSIYAGAGGTDAQDWTQMLYRMYSRFAEKKGLKLNLLEESPGEEAGLKSATAIVEGTGAFGLLKGEKGVHRLVRLSPFNANNLRQTSFAKVEVIPKIDENTEQIIDPKDIKVDVFRSGGHGGQSVNTTDSAVRITHTPTGISVAIQNERSQLQNKETAMTILRSKLLDLSKEMHEKNLEKLKGPAVSAEWGNQIRNYVLHPYKQVKDLRSGHIEKDPDAVLNGELDPFIEAYKDFIIRRK